jgi:hypothetical protein
MNTGLIQPIKTEADYQAALQRAGTLMSSKPNTPEVLEIVGIELMKAIANLMTTLNLTNLNLTIHHYNPIDYFLNTQMITDDFYSIISFF